MTGANAAKQERVISSVFWNLAESSGGGGPIWIEYVRSGLNPSDPLSRMRCALKEKMAPIELNTYAVPNLPKSIFRSQKITQRCVFRCATVCEWLW